MATQQEPIRLSRRAALGLVASGVGATLLAACAPGTPTASPTVSTSASGTSAPAAATAAPAAAAAATPQPKSGGTLRVAENQDVNRLDPHFRLGDTYYTVYDRLTEYDSNHNA